MKDKQVESDNELLELKAAELVALLKKEKADAKQLKLIQRKINEAIDDISLVKATIKPDDRQSGTVLLGDFETLLSEHQIGSRITKRHDYLERFKKILVAIIGVTMMTLGMAMIIMPAPPYFEMFTIFHFNANDGVTLMDLIALLIIFTGVYLFLNVFLKQSTGANTKKPG